MKSFIILTSLFNIASVFAANCASPFGQCGGYLFNYLIIYYYFEKFYINFKIIFNLKINHVNYEI